MLNQALQTTTRLVTNIPKIVNDGEKGVFSQLRNLQSENRLTSHLSNSGEGSSSGILGSPLTPNALSAQNGWYVLIVEDNVVNQKVLAHQIRKQGCQVYVANHGGEALQHIQETKYYKGNENGGKELSIILMDLEMPVMDGLTCVRKIREMQTEGLISGHVPVIAVTANARSEQVKAALDAGMDDVVPKPFRIGHLLPKIEALLANKAGKE